MADKYYIRHPFYKSIIECTGPVPQIGATVISDDFVGKPFKVNRVTHQYHRLLDPLRGEDGQAFETDILIIVEVS